MIQKFTVLSGLVLSATCMVLHQPSIPVLIGLNYDNPNYNFAYEVNDARTGDIKNQHESRRGDAVLGQYSLVQPDGIRRTVDYRADDHTGFQATVNNDGRAQITLEATRPTLTAQSYQQWPASTAFSSTAQQSTAYPSTAYPSNSYPPSAYPSPTPATGISGAVSRTSIVQTFAHSPVSHNPWP